MALYSRPRNTRLLVVSLVMASLLTITVDYRGGEKGPLEAAGQGALQVVAALQSGVSKVVQPIGSFLSGIAHIGSLRSENDALKAQIKALEARAGQSISDRRIIKELTRLLKLTEDLQLKGVTGRVVGESVSNFEWSVTINKGSADKVQQNDPVMSGDGLVGHVIEVAPHACRAQLIIDPDSAVAGRLASSGETGLVVGQRSKPLTMDLVNSGAKVVINDQVVTSGYQSGLYPPEIPIGLVSHVFSRPGSLTTTIELTPTVDFSALEFVLVVNG
ncbi:MAG TPA: rod shape-determining protein MreC [Actinomycetota bacterium]|nr:rod shape-determining protein MreC [Actinomycetota bacterium]